VAAPGESAAGAAPAPGPNRLPPVRLAPREELAALARVAPLMRAARDLDRWAQRRAPLNPGAMPGASAQAHGGQAASQAPDPARDEAGPAPDWIADAAADLDLTPREAGAAWTIAVAVRRSAGPGGSDLGAILAGGSNEEVLRAWDAALSATLGSEQLDGIATALYTVGGPVRMDGLFDAYTAAAGRLPGRPGDGGSPGAPDLGADLSRALEALADLGVVELGTDDPDGGLTVALSALGLWGMNRRLRAQGWHVPVTGAVARDGAPALLAALARCDAEDGEAEIMAWLAAREPALAAAELIDAAANGSPGQRGAAFAVLDRIGRPALDQVRAALARPLLRAHAAVWLAEHGEDIEIDPRDRTWLLVDLGAGLLEEASPQDVVAELLPDLPPEDQAEIVAGLWQVSHPGVTGLLTALSEHHPDPAVARAARKAAFKARSPAPWLPGRPAAGEAAR